MQPGIQTPLKGIVAVSVMLLAFGVVVFVQALAAIRTGTNMEYLSHDRAIDGWEGLFIAFLSVLAGAGGIWAAVRARRGAV
ncbi:MAG TPA: hypothetical protein VFE05_23865 [Longimicrobiaceae bacterium]|jgi:hypothetical protein|nr:hypothetical protein [Longimicrobiaceae bacterium]